VTNQHIMGKPVIITNHARDKVKALAAHGITITETFIVGAFKRKYKPMPAYKSCLAIETDYDEKRVIRVVFEETADAITVITLYPARKGRYGKGEV